MSVLNIPTLLAPTLEEQESARVSIRTLANHGNSTLHIRLEEGAGCDIPPNTAKLLVDMLQVIAEGQSVAVLPMQSNLTLPQAADMLDVSIPYLKGLLDDGEIPFRQEGNHRMVQLHDLLDYERRTLKQRKEILAELVAEGQRLDMGY